jgi:RNA polymerase sigma factor (sigma-70 family)
MAPPRDDIPDFELIRRMADQKADFAQAREAWARFYVRHHGFLLRRCETNHAYVLGMPGVEEVVQDTFMKVFDGASTFNCADACEPSVQISKSRGWLVRISENLIRDRFRRQPEVCTVDEDELERHSSGTGGDPDQTSLPESERLRLLKFGLAQLSDTEQTVLRATMFWWQPDQQHQRMPHEAMTQLSKHVGKSPEAIRQIRLRALKKLESYVRDNLRDENAT